MATREGSGNVTQVATHTFTKGMVSDTATILGNRESYEYAENLRHTNDYTDSLGALTNLKGFEQYTTAGQINSALMIINTCTIRDKLYLLCTSRPSAGGSDSIYRFDINTVTKTLSSPVLLYGGGSLGLSYLKTTDVVGIYEASDNIKLYWSTQGQNIKVANVSTYLTSDGLVKSGGNTWIDYDRFNMITSSTLTDITYEGLTSGTLTTGRVQYAYNLYKEKLQESSISPLSGMINLYSDSEGLATVQIKGDYESVNSGKGVELSITLSSSDVEYYDYIRLYRIHYTEYGQVPQIIIVGDFPISGSTTYSIIDSGQVGLGELTSEEFVILTGLYTAKTLDTKDNRLFAGNITESVFDVDFDARAYRFKNIYPIGVSGTVQNVGSPAFFYEISFSTTINLSVNDVIRVTFDTPTDTQNITVTTVVTPGSVYRFSMLEYGGTSNGEGVITVQDTTQTVCNLYEQYGTYTTPQHTILASTLDYPNTTTELEYNCINPYNDIDKDYDSDYEYIYQSDGTTIGGEGPNISYTFSTSGPNVHIDDTNSYNNPRSYNGNKDYTDTEQAMLYTGYQRGEVYRIGIELYNAVGQVSKVKWIGDIRFPSNSNSTNYDYIAYYNSNQVTNYPIGLYVTVSNLPSSVVSWKIVRVKREKTDRSIVTSGYISLSFDAYNTSAGTGHTNKSPIPIFNTTPITITNAPPVYASFNTEICTFVSAEELFQKDTDIKVGDYLDIVGEIKDYTTYVRNGAIAYPSLVNDGDARQNAIKYRTTHLFADNSNCARYTIEDNKFIEPQQFVTTNELSSIYFLEARLSSYEASSGFSTLVTIGGNISAGGGYHGSCSVIQTDAISNTYFVTNNSDYDIPYVYIKRNTTSRYGGFSYSAREVNQYISCGKIVPSTTATSVFFGGDTYINYFNYKHTIYPINTVVDNHSVDVIFPTESTINISLRSDIFDSNIYQEQFSYFAQEEAGVHTHGSDTFTQETDLYLYNNVYSQEQNIDYDFALNNLDLNTSFDSRIIYSDKKVYDETFDSWLKFRANNFLDIDSKHGQLEVLRNFRNDIYFWQEEAFGIAPVNERSLLNDNNPGALSLGVADVLSRYAYINRDYGCKDLMSVLNTNSSLYWVDRNRKTIIKYDGNTFVDLAKQKGVKQLTKSLIDLGTYPMALTGEYLSVYNKDYNEVLFKVTANKALIFNEFFDVFSSVFTSNSDLLFSTKGIVCTFVNAHLYGHDKTNNYNEFITGTTLTHQNSLLRFSNTDELPYTKVYDNILFYTYSKDSNGYIINNNHFYSASFKNDFQYSICTNTAGSNVLTLNDNLQRKERGYATYIPRNIVNANGTTNIDITNPTNQNSARTYKERMRDKYLQTELIYVNSDYLFVIPEIQLTYRYSKPNKI